MACEKGAATVPPPSEVPPDAGTRVPKLSLQVPGLVADQRNQPVAGSPLGMAEPLSVAVVPVTFEAASVVTDGAAGGVVKVRTLPTDRPMELEATAQK